MQSIYIDGIGGPQDDDVDCLGMNNGLWEVYYTERGQKGDVIFSTANEEEAIKYYLDYVLKIKHWHLVVFTRNKAIMSTGKTDLEKFGIKITQNDIPNYKVSGDYVYRLFGTNNDIFKVNELMPDLPYFDKDLK